MPLLAAPYDVRSPANDASTDGVLGASEPVVGCCPGCQGGEFAPAFETRGVRLEICRACGLVLQNPQPSERILGGIYGPRYFIGSDRGPAAARQFEVVKRATARVQLDRLEAYLRSAGRVGAGMRLLEVGCGRGSLLLEARGRGFHVQGVEVSAHAAQAANARLGTDAVHVGQLTGAGFTEGSFDVCVLADVIEHVRDPHAFLQDIRRLLAREAVVFIATPNVRSLSARLLGQWWPEYKLEHLYYFSPATLTRLLTALDFTRIRVSRGEKILTPAYIFGHFDKHPIRGLGALVRALEVCTPAFIRQREFTVSVGGMDVCATRRA